MGIPKNINPKRAQNLNRTEIQPHIGVWHGKGSDKKSMKKGPSQQCVIHLWAFRLYPSSWMAV
jgi:hypothetical protein